MGEDFEAQCLDAAQWKVVKEIAIVYCWELSPGNFTYVSVLLQSSLKKKKGVYKTSKFEKCRLELIDPFHDRRWKVVKYNSLSLGNLGAMAIEILLKLCLKLMGK